MTQFRPADAIAFALILGYLSLSFYGKQDGLQASILVIVAFYFGKEHYTPSANEK